MTGGGSKRRRGSGQSRADNDETGNENPVEKIESRSGDVRARTRLCTTRFGSPFSLSLFLPSPVRSPPTSFSLPLFSLVPFTSAPPFPPLLSPPCAPPPPPWTPPPGGTALRSLRPGPTPRACTHTHTRTRTHAHTYTYTRARAHICMHICTHVLTHMHTRVHASPLRRIFTVPLLCLRIFG